MAGRQPEEHSPFIIRAKNHEFQDFSSEEEKQWQGPFFFVQGADTQYGMIEGYLEKEEEGGWDKEIILSEKLVEALNQMTPKPKFFVVCGDLLDAFPDHRPDRRALQEIDFKKVFAKLDPKIPLVCVCGNHDVGQTPTKDTVLSYRKSFGDDYFSFWCGGAFFIVINSQYYWDGSMIPEMKADQDKWLDDQLSQIRTSGCKHAVVFQHIPWFINTAEDGDNGIFSFKDELRKTMLDRFRNAGVRAIFCGHLHRNAGGFYGDMEQVVTSAVGAQLGTDKHGARIVKMLDSQIQHHYYAIDDFPSTVQLTSD